MPHYTSYVNKYEIKLKIVKVNNTQIKTWTINYIVLELILIARDS